MASKIAVVTGANQGLGFGIVEELCKRNVEIVYLTSRDLQRGRDAVKTLEKKGYKPKLHQLDVTDEDSVKTFAEFVKTNHGGLDILINNAGLFDADYHNVTYEDAKKIIDVDVHGKILMQTYFFPLLRDNGRVVNISSDWGHIQNIQNNYWVERLTKKDIKLEDVCAFVDWFLDSVKNNTLKKEDFFENTVMAYRVAKVAVSALTRAQQNEVNRGISVNSVNPGYVKTSMTHGSGDLTVSEASIAPVFVALDIDQSVKGKFIWYNKTEVDWADHTLNVVEPFEDYAKALAEVLKSSK